MILYDIINTKMKNNKAQLTIKNSDRDNFEIAITGQLDLHTTAELWQSCMNLQQNNNPKLLTIDTQNLTYCDGAGIGLLLELKKRQIQAQHQFEFKGLSSHLQKLIALITEPSHKIKKQHKKPVSLPVKLGVFAIKVWDNVQENIAFLGMLSYQLAKSLANPKTIRWRDFWKVISDVGPNSLPLIALIGFLVGLITSFQSAIPLKQFGTQIYIINLVSIGLLREMGPLMAAILLAGRTASAFAAEIGTMKINQEIDALDTMGLDPIKFLAIPRVLATTLMTPFLNLFLILFGLIGCAIVMNSLGFNLHIFMNQLESAVHMKDFISGMIKTFVFGIAIASVGCLHGLKTRLGASAVGYSTTQAVVTSIIMIVFIDGIFAAVYYALGI